MEAFDLYEEKQYDLAKAKFRELANIAFRQKDYFNFLVCEFNFKNIPMQFFDEAKEFRYADPLYDGELSELTEQIINSVTGDEKKIIEFFRKIPGYGINKKHKLCDKNNMIINNNNFFTYVKHVFISGTDTEGYYDDILLHEVMHFCGGDGGSVLKEGINELLTRKIAQKYNLRTSSCAYPKEVRLAYELVDIFGEDIITSLAFIKDFNKEIEFIRNSLGDVAAKLYFQVRNESEKEFQEKYYSHMKKFSGIIGVAKKILFYKSIDYSNTYKEINKYKAYLEESNHI